MVEMCGPAESMRVVLSVSEESGELEDEGVQSGPVKWGMLVEGSGGRVVYMVDFEREVRGTVGFGGMEAREVVRALLAGWGEEGLVEEWEEIAYGEMGSDEIAGGQNGDNMEGVAREKEEEKEEEEEEEEKERKIKRRRKTNRRG